MAGTALLLMGRGLFGLGLRILVEGTCPSAATVESQLKPMLSDGAPLEGLVARIGPFEDLLQIEVRSETGSLLSMLHLPRALPCASLAAGAAVAIASAVASLPRSGPQLVTPPPYRPLPPPPPPPPPPRVLWDVDVGIVLAMTHQALTGGGTIEAQLAPYSQRLGGRLGVRIAATGVGMRRLPITAESTSGNGVELIQGSADFTRLSLLVAPRYLLWRDRPLVELHAGPVLSAVIVEGSGFTASYRSRAFDIGIAAGLRVGKALPRIALWSQLGIVGWLRPQELALSGMTPSARLPAWDILLSAGLGFGRFQP